MINLPKRLLRQVEQHQRWLPLLIFAFALSFNCLLGWVYEIPVPRVHDEFAYLLTGETFASGHLTNSSHPMRDFFASFHVFHEPTYQAKYPPGQGAFLALGKLLTGTPIMGVWLNMALACTALFWLLRARFDILLSIYGALFPLLAFHLNWQWSHTYWGGNAALLGGALFLGGVLRFTQPKIRDALAMAAGILLLSQTRPAESIPLIAICLGAIFIQQLRSGWKKSRIPYWLTIIAGGLAAMGITLLYNKILTGDMLQFPHKHWNNIMFQDDAPALIKSYTGSKLRTPSQELLRIGKYFLGPLALCALAIGVVRRRPACPEFIIGATIVIITTAISIAKTAGHPHYLAPILPILYAIVLQALRVMLRHPSRGFPAFAATIIALFFGFNLGLSVKKIAERPEWGWQKERAGIQQNLRKSGENHLIVVRYAPGHSEHLEYVYNAANIDASPVVWARDLGTIKNRELLDYFSDRSTWLLEADKRPNELVPYPGKKVE